MSLKQEPTADGSQTLYSERYGQTFHSDKGAVTESKHVFLWASGVTARLERSLTTSILEVGFGTGLNFFLSADLALKTETPMTFVSLEQSLLSSETVQGLGYEEGLEHPELLTDYCQFRDALGPEPGGKQVFKFKDVRLELLLGEATEQNLGENRFDAIYQDAFSPDANAELWSETFFTKLLHALKPGGKLTTYSVKGEIRRRLKSLGFEVEKIPGPVGGKREMLRATKV